MKTKLMLGDNILSLKKLPENSVDSIVSDPPYGLSFMGKKWDYDVPSVEFWKEVYRVLKPGGHVLSFGGTRTYHRMTVNIEDAGFEIRDQIMWLYGSGFPKSHNIGKAVDKLQGNDREVIETKKGVGFQQGVGDTTILGKGAYEWQRNKGQSPWEGWGTALKPANEPICVARKPLSEKSVADNVLRWGTGGINIDGCRVGSETISVHNAPKGTFAGGDEDRGSDTNSYREHEGRFPANIILDEIAGELLDEQSGVSKSNKGLMKSAQSGNDDGRYNWNNGDKNDFESVRGHNDSGGASRFFYQAKVSKAERNMGLDGFEDKVKVQQIVQSEGRKDAGSNESSFLVKNNHPTVKPVSLMSYLCRLVTPPNGIVLDPFMGSGSTGIAAQLEGFRFVGMEMDTDYMKIAEARINSYEEYRKFIK
jgi:site-specific DNA-methyltransferase (adenine-specific)